MYEWLGGLFGYPDNSLFVYGFQLNGETITNDANKTFEFETSDKIEVYKAVKTGSWKYEYVSQGYVVADFGVELAFGATDWVFDWNPFVTAEDVENEIKGLVSMEDASGNKIAGEVTVEYAPYDVSSLGSFASVVKNYLDNQNLFWKGFNHEPVTFEILGKTYDLGHVFGERTSETILITFKPQDGRYPTLTSEKIIALSDLRAGTNVVFGKTNPSVAYTGETGMDDIYDAVLPYVVNESGDSVGVVLTSEDLVILNQDEEEVAVDSLEPGGSYIVKASFAGNEVLKPSDGTIGLFADDGRNRVEISLNDNAEVPFDFEANKVTNAAILEKLEISVLDVTADPDVVISDYSISYKKDGREVAPEAMKVGETYTVEVSFAGNNTQAPASASASFSIVDARAESVLTLNEGVSFPYGTELDEEDMFNLVFGSLKTDAGEDVPAQFGDFVVSYPNEMNVGTHTVVVEYKGDANHKPARAEVVVTVEKAPVDVSIESQIVKYADIKGSGVNISDLASSDPAVDLMTFAVGLNLGDNASADAGVSAYVDLPELIDLDSITNSFVRSLIERALDELGTGTSMSVSQLKDALQSFLSAVEILEGYGIDLGLSTEGVDLLVSALEQIEQLEGVGDLTVYLTMGEGINIKDSGAYITGAVSSDANYETDLALGYLAITPDGTKVDLAFNVEDANGLITLKNVQNGNYDLGSHVVEAEGVDVEAASKRLNDLYVGVDYQGNPVIIQGVDNVASQMGVGAYIQVSYIRDLGNEMFYAMPIVRSFAVVTDLVDVRFVGDVDENNQSVFGYDGAEKFMLAEAYDRAGNELDSANITYTYAGIEGDAEGHLSSGKADSVEGPTEVGIYTVIATYVDYAANGEPANVGMTIGSMIITPAEASVTVNDAAHIYNGSPVDVLGMIEKTPADAKMAVVTAGFDVEGEFSLDNLEAVKGVVNVDFPTRVDDVLKQVVPSAYSEGVTLTTLINKLSEIEASLEASGTNANGISDLIAVLEQLPNASKLTFKEQADVNPVDNGAYLVGAVIMDPNYQADADLGVLIIAPEFATVTFVDDSGSPNNDRLFTYDGNQHAMPVVVKTAAGQTIVGEDLENLKVVYMGVEGDAEGYCSTTPPSQVGAYSVVATYVERDANGELLRIGKATGVMAIQPAVAEFEVKDATHIYDGTEKFVEVSNPDGLPQIAYVVVDAQNNVNVIAPESWSVTARELENVDEVIAQLISEFEEMAEATENESRKAALNKLVEILKSVEIETLSINGKKPVAIGEYAVHAIGFGDANINPAYDKGILSIVERPYSTIQLADGVNDDEVDVTVSYGETTNAVGAEPTEIPAGVTTTVKASATDSNKEIVSVTVKDSAGNVVATTDQVAVAAAEAEEIQLEFATPSDKIENYTVNVVLREKDVPGGNEPGGSGGSGDDSGESDDPNPDDPNGPTNPDEPSAPGASDGGEGAKPSTGDAKNESQAASVIPNTGDGAGMIMGVFGALATVAALAVLVAVRRLSVRS